MPKGTGLGKRVDRTPRKRPGRHAKKSRKGSTTKRYRGQGKV